MHKARLYFFWLFVPAVMVVAAFLFMVISADKPQMSSYEKDAQISLKSKLKRTLNAFDDDNKLSFTSNNYGFAGLNIELLIKENEWSDLINMRNIRKNFKKKRHDLVVRFNNERSVMGTYRLRGTSSIKIAYAANHPEMLCYNITLLEKIKFSSGIKLKRFYLMNMVSDQYYYKMRFSYNILKELGLFPAYTQFVALKINGEAIGLYLLVERPKDAIRRANSDVPEIYRRRRIRTGKKHARFKDIYTTPQLIRRREIKNLYSIVQNKTGKDLIDKLMPVVNLDAYLTWLSFNSLILNQDIQDEVFFYVSKSDIYPKGRIEFMAWDYDDIMKPVAAHQDFALIDPLLFACEAELDHLIKKKPVLYDYLKKIMKNLLLNVLDEKYLKEQLYKVSEEVNNIDRGFTKQADFKQKRKNEMNEFEKKLLSRRIKLLGLLEN